MFLNHHTISSIAVDQLQSWFLLIFPNSWNIDTISGESGRRNKPTSSRFFIAWYFRMCFRPIWQFSLFRFGFSHSWLHEKQTRKQSISCIDQSFILQPVSFSLICSSWYFTIFSTLSFFLHRCGWCQGCRRHLQSPWRICYNECRKKGAGKCYFFFPEQKRTREKGEELARTQMRDRWATARPWADAVRACSQPLPNNWIGFTFGN